LVNDLLTVKLEVSKMFFCLHLTLFVGQQEGHPACKNRVVRCWHGCLSGARCRLAYVPADAIATHCLLYSKIQIGFFVLVLAHLGSPGKRAVKRVCVQSFKAVKSCRKDLYMVRCKSVCDYRLLSEHVLVMISVPVISFMLHSLLIIMIIEVE